MKLTTYSIRHVFPRVYCHSIANRIKRQDNTIVDLFFQSRTFPVFPLCRCQNRVDGWIDETASISLPGLPAGHHRQQIIVFWPGTRSFWGKKTCIFWFRSARQFRNSITHKPVTVKYGVSSRSGRPKNGMAKFLASPVPHSHIWARILPPIRQKMTACFTSCSVITKYCCTFPPPWSAASDAMLDASH